jgi:hypothetical protein
VKLCTPLFLLAILVNGANAKELVGIPTITDGDTVVIGETKNLKRQKEEAARPCLAADIARMEGLAAKASGAVKSESSLEEAQAALSLITGHQGEVGNPKDSIKDRVVVNSIDTRCDAPFHFLINVREGPDKKFALGPDLGRRRSSRLSSEFAQRVRR